MHGQQNIKKESPKSSSLLWDLCGVGWQSVADVSGPHTGPIFHESSNPATIV